MKSYVTSTSSKMVLSALVRLIQFLGLFIPKGILIEHLNSCKVSFLMLVAHDRVQFQSLSNIISI